MKHQKESFGCGLYAICNALLLDISEDDFTRFMYRLENGGNMTKEAGICHEASGQRFCIEPLFYNRLARKIPRRVIQFLYKSIESDGNNWVFPVLLDQRHPDGKGHTLGAWVVPGYSDIILFDSKKTKPKICSWDLVFGRYPDINGLRFFTHECDNVPVVIKDHTAMGYIEKHIDKELFDIYFKGRAVWNYPVSKKA